MQPFPVHLAIFIFVSLTRAAAEQIYSKPGCPEMCGETWIPYPFGVGESCSLNKWYSVDCSSSSKLYLSAFNKLEVLDVDIKYQIVTVNASIRSVCQTPLRNGTQALKLDLGDSPFVVDSEGNKFVFQGCGTASISDQGDVLSSCSTNCSSENGVRQSNVKCNSVNCCRDSIPNYLRNYSMEVESQGLDGGCGYAFLVDENSYDAGMFVIGNDSFVPMRLIWTLETRLDAPYCFNHSLDLGKGNFMENWPCTSCRDARLPQDGNPYLCQDTEECTRCKKRGGYCDYIDLPGGQKFNCYGRKTVRRDVILGVSLSMGVLFLIACSLALYKVIKGTEDKRRRKRFFKRNGGKLLKQQQEADKGLVDRTILFSKRALEKATANFNENRILGHGGQGTVYKGMLTDGRIVAIKRSKLVDGSQLKEFINEVVVLSQVSHRNVVKLLGCCLETEVPLLVSEFIANGTLFDHLHDKLNEFPISLKMRLKMAAEVAGALSYLHSATSIPIYHRDIKTTNILLDEKYQAKISDFGASRFVSIDQTHLTTNVKGTFGYMDPEYWHTSQFTEKSDVYSFGVVLAELLTGEKPISVTRFGEHRNLAMHFTSAVEEGQVMTILDANVLKEGVGDEVMVVVDLVMRCLNANGRNRPSMKEVASELEGIRKHHLLVSTPETDFGEAKYDDGEDESFGSSYSESTLTRSFGGNIVSNRESESPSKRNAMKRSLSLNLGKYHNKSYQRGIINAYGKQWTQ